MDKRLLIVLVQVVLIFTLIIIITLFDVIMRYITQNSRIKR